MIVLDSWAILALLYDEPAAARVERAMEQGDCIMSWINAGEVYYLLARASSTEDADRALRELERSVRLVLPDAATIKAAAQLKSRHRISYADAFAAATAISHEAPLWTGDPELLVPDGEWEAVDLRD